MTQRSPKFYSKSLTLLLPIIKLIQEGLSASEIAQRLDLGKQRVSYHISNLKAWGYVKETGRDVFKLFEVTQAGKNFVAMYQKSILGDRSICRAENIRFKAHIIKVPARPIDWTKVEMHNWTQYSMQLEGVKVKLNEGNDPTIEFIPSAIDGDDPIKIWFELFHDCNDAANKIEQTLDIKIGRLEPSSKGEWVVYHPLAKKITKTIGRVTVKDIGKINASMPGRFGEFEFYDPRIAAEFLHMPMRLARLEQKVDKFHKFQENN
jgi:biotin operon repressor